MDEAPRAAPRVGRTAATIAPLVIAGRGVAFLVPIVVAHVFGAIPATDAFFVALAAPMFVMIVTANAVAPAVTPAVARREERAPAEVGPFVTAAALGVGLGGAALAGLVAGLGALAPDAVVPADTRHLVVGDVIALIPFAALTGAAVPLRVGAEVSGAFAGSSMAALVRGVVTIGGVVALAGPVGAHALPLAYGLGQAAEIAWYLALLRHRGRLALPGPLAAPWREAGAALAPLAVAQALIGLAMGADRAFAAQLPDGSVSLLEYADRTRFIPQTLLESSLVAVAFATWSRLVARGDQAGFDRQLDQSLRWAIAWASPVVAGLIVTRHLLVKTLYEHGAFTPADTVAVADTLAGYAPGVVGVVVTLLVGRALVVLGQAPWVIALAATHATTNLVLDAIWSPRYGIFGIGLANAAAMCAAALVAIALVRRRVAAVAAPADWARVAVVVAASAGVAGVAWVRGGPVAWGDPRVLVGLAEGAALVGLAVWASRPRDAAPRLP